VGRRGGHLLPLQADATARLHILPAWITHCPGPLKPFGMQDGVPSTGGVVLLSDGATVPYDWLVLALGSETNTYGIPGVKEHALAFNTYSDAVKVGRWVYECGRMRVCWRVCPHRARQAAANIVVLEFSTPTRCESRKLEGECSLGW
jgi:hypothetical protein